MPMLAAVATAERPRQAFKLGYLYGWAQWGLSVIWVGNAVVNWSGTSIGWVAWIGLTAILGLWFGLIGMLVNLVWKRAGVMTRAPLVAMVCVSVEWLRGQGSLAMPWTISGYTQYRYPYVIQIADLAGMYAVCFLVWWANAALMQVIWTRPTAPKAMRRIALLPAIAVVASMLYGVLRIQSLSKQGEPITLIAIQPDRPSGHRTREQMMEDYGRLQAMADKINPGDAEIVVWPETITPDDATQPGASQSMMSAIAKRTYAYHLVGTTREDENGIFFNSAAVFDPTGKMAAVYDKHWLVPYGEWIPLRSIMPFAKTFGFGETDTGSGHDDKPLKIGNAVVSPIICFESIFPVVSRTRATLGAELIVLMTNDSWGGRSSALLQHHAMTVFRAVETHRWIVAAATTGITAAIQPDGGFVALEPHRQDILRVEARRLHDISFYTRYGDWLPILCLLGVVTTLIWSRRKPE
jgi:apolipoprotein N-acyltransferase